MSKDGLIKFETQFTDFFRQAVHNPKILETNKLRSKFILQRLYFLDRADELQEALQFLQNLKLISSIAHPNISGIIAEVENNLPQIIRQSQLITTINDITFDSNASGRMKSAGRNNDRVKGML
jgi:hypothetical protein